MKKSRWMSILAAFMLPIQTCAAQAMPTAAPNVTPVPTAPRVTAMPTAAVYEDGLTENQVVALPTSAPLPRLTFEDAGNEYGFGDREAYYAGQTVGLSAEEAARVPAVQLRYNTGERAAKSVLNQVENVVLGVYDLPAEQYEGEGVFTILPDRALTDEELLQLIDAFETLGRTFDPAALTWRNCMRGGSVESTRGYTAEEADRYTSLIGLYKRGTAAPERAFTALPCDDGVGIISLASGLYSGLEGFRFHPARRLTDEELLELAACEAGEQSATSDEYNTYEAQARKEMNRLLGMPLSAKRLAEFIDEENHFCVWGTDRQIYQVQFESADLPGRVLCAHIDTQTGLLAWGAIYGPTTGMYSDLHRDPFERKWQDIAAAWVREHLKDDIAIVGTECGGEVSLQSIGYGACVFVNLADGASYQLSIAFSSEQPYDIQYCDKTRTQNRADYYKAYSGEA